MTELLYRTDAYIKEIPARVVDVNPQGGIVLDRTPFYASAGGQPGDRGVIHFAGGECAIATTVYDSTDKSRVVHVAAEGAPRPAAGDEVTVALDWALRHRHMRMHTALHLMCSLVKFPVTGGQIGADEGRLDFDIEDASAVDKDKLTADIMALVAADHPVGERWITDAELEANPGLVRTMSVKPPMGSGRVRLVLIGETGSVDMQPCGGTHVRSTSEIGAVAVTKIEKKGKINRRIRVAFV
ncbi:MAG TPA: alanyl-tRNA editing protein [Hyphomicrobiaceae bacterium]|nr:alanyl-tRNA editing protein [Hyphomicrobiaceae bacterium]